MENIRTIYILGLPDGSHPTEEYRFEVDLSSGRVSVETEYRDFGEYYASRPEQVAWLEGLGQPALKGGFFGVYFLEDGPGAMEAFLRILEPFTT